MEPLSDQADLECLVARAVANADCGRVPVRMKNLGTVPVHLKRNQKVACFSLVMPADVFSEGVDLILEAPNTVMVQLQQVTEAEAPSDACIPVDLSGAILTPEQTQQVHLFLAKHKDVFSRSDHDYGKADAVFHQIPTGEAPPVRERHRQIPPTLYQEVCTLIQGMLEAGVISKSISPCASPVVLVRKKDGTLRFCEDYRKLNSVTRKDSFPLPCMEESLTMLSKAKLFSTLDLANGYWQVTVHPSDQENTAFTTPMGLYEFSRMPLGLCNAPATFQRLMESSLGDQNFQSFLIYLDDIIVFSHDFPSHLKNLERVFQRLVQHGLKLKPSKCHLFKAEVQYLGHVVTEDGVTPSSERVQAITEWPRPQTVRELRAFLGLISYYRRFIKDFSKIAMPLHAQLVGQPKKSPRRTSPPLQSWTTDCEEAFQQLKHTLVRAPILAFADFSLSFCVVYGC